MCHPRTELRSDVSSTGEWVPSERVLCEPGPHEQVPLGPRPREWAPHGPTPHGPSHHLSWGSRDPRPHGLRLLMWMMSVMTTWGEAVLTEAT